MHVVLLFGSSTAGKTSLCKELVTKHQWSSGSVDEACAKIMPAYFEKLKSLVLKELQKQNHVSKLQSYMTEDDMQQLAVSGLVTLSRGEHQLTHLFHSPDLEGLETILKNAGFTDSATSDLAHTLRHVTKLGDTLHEQHPLPEPMEKLYDETLHTSNSGKSIVLDVVPHPNETAKECLSQFEKRAQLYREQNPNETLTTSVVFAYCPPQKLSERIQERNRKAEIADPGDKRVGLFPFDQLAKLVTAEKNVDDSSENTLSRTELFYLINKHANTDKTGDALFLENPVDPDAWQQSHAEEVQITTFPDDVVKLSLQSDDMQLSVADQPRIGSTKTIEEYGKLAKRFGFFENQELTSLNITQGLSFDAVINTAKGTPEILATEFVKKLEKSKTTSQRISIL